MSVLLDALKKAALEKQKRDAMLNTSADREEVEYREALTASGGDSDAEDNGSQPHDSQLYSTSTKTLREYRNDFPQSAPALEIQQEEELSVDVDFYELERLDRELESQKQLSYSPADSAKNGILISDKVNSLLATDSATENVEDKDGLLIDNSHAGAELDERSASNGQETICAADSQHAAPGGEGATLASVSSESTHAPVVDSAFRQAVSDAAANTFADEILAQIGGEPDAADSSQKLSFQRLLEYNRTQLRKKKRVFVALFSSVTVLAVALVALYFFYVSNQSSSFTRPLNAGFNAGLEHDSVDPTEIGGESLEIAQEMEQGMEQELRKDDRTILYELSDEEAGEQAISEQEMESPIASAAAATTARKNPSPKPVVEESISGGKPKAVTSSSDVSGGEQSSREQSNSANKTVPSEDNGARAGLKPATAWQVQSKPAPVNAFGVAINRGFDAYQRGDWQAAQRAYDDAMRLQPHHRDAILGSAAVAAAQGQHQRALILYQQRLADAPNDHFAQAGIVAIASTRDAGPELLSKVNTLLQEYPDAAHLHFLKGSLYAKQQQWTAAQAAFFRAWSYQNDRGDYAYNLAIALDHIRQPEQALRYYRLALAQSNNSVAAIDINRLNKRIRQLEARSE